MLDSIQDLNSRLHVLTNKQTNKNTTTFTTDQKCTLTFFSYLNTSYQDSWQNLGTFLEKKEFAKMSAIQVVLLVFCYFKEICFRIVDWPWNQIFEILCLCWWFLKELWKIVNMHFCSALKGLPLEWIFFGLKRHAHCPSKYFL